MGSRGELENYHRELVDFETRNEMAPVPKIVVANKRDLVHGIAWQHMDSSKTPPRRSLDTFQNMSTCPAFSVSAKMFAGLHSAIKQILVEVEFAKDRRIE